MRSKLVTLALVFLCACIASGESYASGKSLKIELAPGLPGIPVPLPGLSKLTRHSHPSFGNQRTAAVNLVRQGCELDKQGRHSEALAKFEEATQVDPSYETASSNLVTACLVNGKLHEGMNAARQFLLRFPNSEQTQEVICMVNSMKVERQRRIVAAQCTGKAVGPGTTDYFAYQLVRKVRRWPAHLMPIKVWIASGKGVRQYRASFKRDLLESFQEWSDGCHGLISFALVDDPQQASILCEWIDDINKFPSHSGIEGGETIPYYNSRGLARARILLLTRPRTNKGKELDAAMRHVCLHEIGHSLGLMEHSDSPDDIMFYAFQGDDRTRPKLSNRDVLTLVRLYSCNLVQVNDLAGLQAGGRNELASRLPLADQTSSATPPSIARQLELNLPAPPPKVP